MRSDEQGGFLEAALFSSLRVGHEYLLGRQVGIFLGTG